MKHLLTTISLLIALSFASAQPTEKTDPDSANQELNMDAIYNRPFLQIGKSPVSIGGYIEANSSYFGSDGVTEGLSFQVPRMTIFLSGYINNSIRFLSEIELEEGGKEIAIEFAALDVELHPLLNLRGGIIMNPIGAFNQNHDGPKWEFIDRPIASTTIIPSTWSNVGFGIFGKYGLRDWVLAYETYLTNGFDDRIITNDLGRTWLPASKAGGERFEESFNGVPLITAKVAFRYNKIGEIGLSWMGGVYNRFRDDGLAIDKKRRIDLLAVDYNTVVRWTNTNIVGEYVWALVDVPVTYSHQFGTRQEGGFVDLIQTIWKPSISRWENARVNLALRLEYTDYNVGKFIETEGNIADHTTAIVPAISFRPSGETVFRFNYRIDHSTDLFGNPAIKTIGYQFGFSSYF